MDAVWLPTKCDLTLAVAVTSSPFVTGTMSIEFKCFGSSSSCGGDDDDEGSHHSIDFDEEERGELAMLLASSEHKHLVSSGQELRFHCDGRFVKIESMKVWTGNRKRGLRIASTSTTEGSSCSVKLADDAGSAVGSAVELVATFQTRLRDGQEDPHGIYSCGSGRVATHFEVDHARGAFPCPDHPLLRMAWSVTVQHPDRYVCFGNGPVVASKASGAGGSVQTTFAPVGPFLPAYCIGLYLAPSTSVLVTPVTVPGGGGCCCRVISPAGSSFPVDVVVSALQAALPLLKSYLPSPEDSSCSGGGGSVTLLLPCASKLDVVVVPRMPIGGMEHHGLIFLNEAVGTKGTKAKQMVEITELVVHEVAHHWVGNAVGMPFAIKEGICQVLEQCLGDVALGRPMRKYAVSMELAAASLEVEAGQELTGHTYQRALNFMMHYVSCVGFAPFCAALSDMLRQHWGGYISEHSFMKCLAQKK